MFIKYPEMKTLFKLIPLDEKGKKWDATNGEILPETAPLHFIPLEDLVFTEKIDGTNMGIRIDDSKVTAIQKRTSICNREDKSDQFYFELGDKITRIIEDKSIEELSNVIIYGELCGVKIQKGGNYFPERHFIIFDIFDTVSNKFFTWDALKYFCELLQLEIVPEIEYNRETLNVDYIKDFLCNQMSVYNDKFGAEGIVIRYKKDTSYIKRWMAKIRRKDFNIK